MEQKTEVYGPVVQLVRTLACHARGRRFEPVPGRHFFIYKLAYGFIAQLVEQGTENPCVPGSIPGEATKQKSEQKITKFSVISKKCIC